MPFSREAYMKIRHTPTVWSVTCVNAPLASDVHYKLALLLYYTRLLPGASYLGQYLLSLPEKLRGVTHACKFWIAYP